MGELTWLEVLRDLDQRRLTTEAAGQLLGLERRHVFRLLKGVQGRGSDGSDLEATRSPEQPAQTGGASGQGVGDHPGALGRYKGVELAYPTFDKTAVLPPTREDNHYKTHFRSADRLSPLG
jgi:hypothetical protein